MSVNRSSGHAVLIIVIVVVAVAILGFLGWLFWQNFINKPSTNGAVTTFEQCKAAKGSTVQETLPERCVTADGKSFTGPVASDNSMKMKSYCATAEKLCFEYPETWTINQLTVQDPQPGAKTDFLEVKAPNDGLILTLESGIGGLGGNCSDEFKVPVTVLAATPAASMTGFKDQYSIDILQVARAYYPNASGKYTATLYITDTAEYSTPGTLQACGIGFSEFINGRNAVLSSDFSGAGSFTFGYNGQSGPTYANATDAEAVYSTEPYQQGAAILASLHYE